MPQKSPRTRRARRAPSCRGGASSLLRLAQPATSRSSGHGFDITAWLARAASVLTPESAHAIHVGPTEFAPSQWLVGH